MSPANISLGNLLRLQSSKVAGSATTRLAVAVAQTRGPTTSKCRTYLSSASVLQGRFRSGNEKHRHHHHQQQQRPTDFLSSPSSKAHARRWNTTTPNGGGSSFTFAGPRKLDEIMKLDSLELKTGTEIADMWYTYHETRVRSVANV